MADKLTELEALAIRLDDAVANFLDADAAWDANECSERTFIDAHNFMRSELYAVRDARKALLAKANAGSGNAQ